MGASHSFGQSPAGYVDPKKDSQPDTCARRLPSYGTISLKLNRPHISDHGSGTESGCEIQGQPRARSRTQSATENLPALLVAGKIASELAQVYWVIEVRR